LTKQVKKVAFKVNYGINWPILKAYKYTAFFYKYKQLFRKVRMDYNESDDYGRRCWIQAYALDQADS
jgi:hypothetical protein